MSTFEQFLASKARGSAAGATDLGVPLLGVRKDTAADLAGADGDYAPPQYDSTGNLRVVDEAVKGLVDGLEGLITTLNGYVDGLETLMGTSNTLATTLNGYVDGLETLAGAAIPAGTNLIGKVGIDQTTPGTTDRVTVGKSTVVDVTLSLDTSAYASGDVLADTQPITGLARVNDFGAVLQSITVIDKDDQGAAFDIYFLDANVAMGSENSAPSISDANAASILGKVSVTTSDYVDLGGVKVAVINVAGLPLKPASGGTTGYLAVVNGTGTPTYTASGVVVRLGMLQD